MPIKAHEAERRKRTIKASYNPTTQTLSLWVGNDKAAIATMKKLKARHSKRRGCAGS